MSKHLVLLIAIFCVFISLWAEAKPAPQADGFTSGSILAPWGGNLGGGWGGGYGGYSSSASYRYNNGLGFL